MLFIIVGTVNAVNLTDGIDGLDASVTMVAAMGFMVIASIAGFSQMNLLAAALAGGCLGFLVWNFHPAKVFMGDTGSLSIGGIIAVFALCIRKELLQQNPIPREEFLHWFDSSRWGDDAEKVLASGAENQPVQAPTTDQLLILYAGGPGIKNMIIPGWFGARRAVTRRIQD